MFASLVREGELVSSPTGRKWFVVGWEDGRKRVELLAEDGSGDTCALPPSILKHVDSKYAGRTLDALREEDAIRIQLLEAMREPEIVGN